MDQINSRILKRLLPPTGYRGVVQLWDQLEGVAQKTEVRSIAADGLWMSPFYKRDSVDIHLPWDPDWAAVKLLPKIEAILAAFKPRPHWGKLFALRPNEIQSSYERLPDFRALAANYDPKGNFHNPFLKTHLGL